MVEVLLVVLVIQAVAIAWCGTLDVAIAWCGTLDVFDWWQS